MTRKWRMAVPLTVLVTIHVASLFGGFLAPNSAIRQNRALPWAPPSKLRFVDKDGHFHLRPFVYPLVTSSSTETGYLENTMTPCPVRFFVRGDSYHLLGLLPTNIHFLGVEPPARLYLLGSDRLGRDLFARTLVGGRASLLSGLLAALITLAVGTLVGATAGYVGGRTDQFLMGTVELFLALPWLYLLLAIRAFLPLNQAPLASFTLVVLIIALVGWARPARLIRGAILSYRQQLFVTAARCSGVPETRILTRHLLPHVFTLLWTQAAILVPAYILAEVALSFLGLGIPQPTPSWGNLLAQLQRYHILANHPLSGFPAIPLTLVSVSYYSLLPIKLVSSRAASSNA